jgi:hypothetical protein
MILPPLWQWVAVFFSMVFVDMLWAKYMLALAGKQAMKSALLSGGIILCGVFTTISYVENHWLVIPAAIGAFIGTYFTVKHHKD